jgi:hypothetical protein
MKLASYVTLLSMLVYASASMAAVSSDPGFSNDRAYEHLKVIAGDIGGRPMGSPNEARAMHYALEQLKSFGCQDTYLMPMKVASGVNTTSGIAVGVLKGKTGRIILVGGHIDSVSPEVPGANDDGSGSACVLEVARVLAQKPHESTILFCLWGGEEQGLRGSEYFVANYPLIDSVALMFQLDMVDGAGELELDPDGGYQKSAPRWLVDAACEEFFRNPEHKGLVYYTQFSTINSAAAGATGSDHDSFIGKGIPAIDFTSDVSYPIHTPLDRLSNFDPSGFARAGETVISLVERFDHGQPPQKLEQYWLLLFGSTPVFVPYWALYAFWIGSLVGAIALFFVLWRRERTSPPHVHVSWSGAKLLVVTLVVNFFVWMSPTLVSVLSGYQFPWAGRFPVFEVFGIVSGILGLLLMVRWLLKVNISYRVAPLFLRAAVLPFIYTLVAGAYGLELAIYPAAILALFTIAVALRRPWIGAVSLILSVVVMHKVVLGEAVGLFQVGITGMTPEQSSNLIAYHVISVVLPAFLTLPYAYAAAALYRAVGRDFLRVRTLSGNRGLAIAAASVVILAGILAAGSPYNPKWTPAGKVKQMWSKYDTTGSIHLYSSETMHGTTVRWNGKDTTVNGTRSAVLQAPKIDPDRWCALRSRDTVIASTDSTRTVEYTLTIHMPIRPFRINVNFSSSQPLEGYSPVWSMAPESRMGPDVGTTERNKSFKWVSFPDTTIVIPVRLTYREGQVIAQSIEAQFDALDTPAAVDHMPGWYSNRLIISRADTLRSLVWKKGVAANDIR